MMTGYWAVKVIENAGEMVEACPIQFNDDGSFNVILGFTLMTTVEALIANQNVEKVWEFDDLYEPNDVKQLYPQAESENKNDA